MLQGFRVKNGLVFRIQGFRVSVGPGPLFRV